MVRGCNESETRRLLLKQQHLAAPPVSPSQATESTIGESMAIHEARLQRINISSPANNNQQNGMFYSFQESRQGNSIILLALGLRTRVHADTRDSN